jgi:hypothetical protein
MIRSDGEYREMRATGTKEEKKRGKQQQQLGGAISLLGIANLKSSRSLALSLANPEQASAVMRWDLVNPWARFYQLHSTHPLTAFRVRALNEESESMHQPVSYKLPASQPSDRKLRFLLFPFELILWAAPFICGILYFFGGEIVQLASRVHLQFPHIQTPCLLIACGVTWMLRIAYRYRGTFKSTSIGSLIENTEVSQMNPIAVELRGEIIGNGVPGAFWSPDLVLRDETGMVFMLYRSSIPLARLFFGLGKADRFIGEKVALRGWFRRGLTPYVEMSTLTAEVTRVAAGSGPVSLFGPSSTEATFTPETLRARSYSRWIQTAAAAVLTTIGIIEVLN